jgi:hypothetical protein
MGRGKRKASNGVIGCLALIPLLAFLYLWLGSYRQPILSDQAQMQTAQSEVAPLEAQLRALDGVQAVQLVSQIGQIVHLELRVAREYNAQPFAEQLYFLARGVVGDIDEFSAILDDGVSAISYLWTPRSGWTSTPLSR